MHPKRTAIAMHTSFAFENQWKFPSETIDKRLPCSQMSFDILQSVSCKVLIGIKTDIKAKLTTREYCFSL